ncbi:ubiquitin-specific protease UBP14 [Saccharomyces paradoxus]|uniref:Ubiquitin carboxyl-terminal hydrolase n=1 Tax=Saccharomyces paradoxus TaxID=27291 RepID=A0A8B8ULL8_SACPA|nr:Ubp14 [Saccharomyces paradoxus]QHS71621.1 Ubp14 [Saccharomyces paradoxus]
MAEEILENITIPAVVSKDECIYCFESPYNEPLALNASPKHSLNICLNCFQATCNRHLPLHTRVTEYVCDSLHSNYLTIAKVEKPKQETADENNNNKKIKLQVIERSEDETHNTIWSLQRFNNENIPRTVLLKSTDSDISSMSLEKVEKILRAKSQDFEDKKNSWELEISTCPHTENFQIPTKPENAINLNQCSSCDLTQNLWLCLHCGNIGCGREQIGIDGHSHALDHYRSNNNHPLAIKLGSLSSSTCDLYCYACDDETRFPDNVNLGSALQIYGINIQEKIADEKTLIQLQVEQNENWQFRMVDSSGKEFEKLFPSKDYGCGLINLGNSCYLNSVIQSLLNGGVPNWSLDFLGSKFPLDVVYPGNNLKCQLIKLLNAMKCEPELYPNGIKPTTFKKCIGQNHEEFSSNRQQDAMEFLTFLLDLLDRKFFSSNSSGSPNPNDLVRFMMEDRLQCNSCGKVKYSYEPAEAIQIPLEENDEPQDLLERIKAYFEGQTIEFKCANCKEKVTANKRPGFKSLPQTLVLNPIRIRLQNWIPVKTSNELSLPGLMDRDDVLDVSSYLSQGFNPQSEDLLPDEDENQTSFTPNQCSVSQLIEMGFTQNASVRALFNTGNQDAESAMNWLFQHMDDPDLNDTFVPPPTGPKKGKGEVDEVSLTSMLSMGLNPNLCRKALVLNNGDVNRSVEWVFNNLDDDGTLSEPEVPTEQQQQQQRDLGYSTAKPYVLTAVVCHKGNSVHSGHYVVFIRKLVANKWKWVLYNDEKMVAAESIEDMKKNGYIYFYTRC